MTDDSAIAAFTSWYAALERYASDFPAKGTIAGALVVLERLKTTCDLSIDSHTAKGGSQIIGASGTAVRRILLERNEHRQFVSEGGRTNRGLRGAIKGLLETLDDSRLSEMTEIHRNALLSEMQTYLVERVRDWFNQQRIEVFYDDKKTTRDLVHQILEKARIRGQDGPVAQYLVGAKLQIRFPATLIENFSYSTADLALGRSGDFVLGDTAFHVTVSPMDKVYDRCRRNLESGMKSYLLVPGRLLHAVRTNADSVAPDAISVEAIESFVGGNVDELAEFSTNQLVAQLRLLIETYNERVNKIEIDKSMMIDLPHNLEPRGRRSR